MENSDDGLEEKIQINGGDITPEQREIMEFSYRAIMRSYKKWERNANQSEVEYKQ